MYILQTRSVFAGLNSDGDSMFEVVDGKYLASYTVKVLKENDKYILCMYSGTGLLLDDTIFLAHQNLNDMYHFKRTVVMQAKIPAEIAKLIREDEIAFHHCGLTCKVYLGQDTDLTWLRYISLSQSNYYTN